MTREYLLSRTNNGIDIFQHLIRKEFPDHIMHVSGSDCGDCPDPVWADGTIIHVTIDRIPVPGQRLPNFRARYHYINGEMFDGDALALAAAYYNQRGERLSQDQLIARLAEELHIKEPRAPFFETEPEEQEPPKPALPPCPKMNFFRRPIKNTKPCREASPQDIYKYLISDYAKAHTEHIRTIADNRERSRYKAANLDYITPGGIFASRKESELLKASGYMVIDFDHIPNAAGLVKRLAGDTNFETILASPEPSCPARPGIPTSSSSASTSTPQETAHNGSMPADGVSIRARDRQSRIDWLGFYTKLLSRTFLGEESEQIFLMVILTGRKDSIF